MILGSTHFEGVQSLLAQRFNGVQSRNQNSMKLICAMIKNNNNFILSKIGKHS